MFSWRCVVCIDFLTCFYLRGAGFYRLDALPVIHPSIKTSSPIQINQLKNAQVWLPHTISGLETDWVVSQRKR